MQDDESRLLFDDPNGVHYGSFGEQQMNGHEDPQEVQREIEALQRVVARTSEYIFPLPLPPTLPYLPTPPVRSPRPGNPDG